MIYIRQNISVLNRWLGMFILISLILIGLFSFSCNDNPYEPVDDIVENSYLFVEMGVYSTGVPKGDTVAYISIFPSTYYFNDKSRVIEVDSTLQRNPIREEDKCIIGSYTILGPRLGDGKVGTLKTISSFPHLDTFCSPPFLEKEEIVFSKMNSDGSIEINFNQQTFALPINSLYQFLRKRTNIEVIDSNFNFKQKYDTIQHLFSIRNWGYIKKNNLIIK